MQHKTKTKHQIHEQDKFIINFYPINKLLFKWSRIIFLNKGHFLKAKFEMKK